MKITDFLDPSAICLELKSSSKQDVLTELCALLQASGKITDPEPVLEALMTRERLGSTGIGQGIAIPHGKTAGTDGIVAALGVSKRGINFESLDGAPVHLVFMLVAPKSSAGEHLKALARISGLLKDKFFRQALREARSVEDVQKVISEDDSF